MKRELSGKVNRELSGKTLEDLSDDEIVEVIVDTVKEQARAVRYEVGVDLSTQRDTTGITIRDREVRASADYEAQVVGHVESIHYNSKAGYSMTIVITDKEMIKKISGGNECQSLRLSSKMKTDKS